MVFVQLATLGIYLKRINAFHESISRKKRILENYSLVLHYLQQEKFSSEEMQAITRVAHQADVRMKKLASLVSSFNARTNSLMAFIVNSFFMYDLQYVYRLEEWKEQNKTDLQQWLEAISKTELLISFATFGYNHPSFINAEISDTIYIEASELGHPLIDPKECITNSITIGNGPGVLIVTGANMAGKSTFLRTLGTNIVLALNGAPVFAKKFKCPLIRLRTGMRTADSLKDHQSYFYAELDRLKSIMDELRSNKPLLILLDEILKGTNSTDKQAGSIALVKQLLPHPCLAIIATHDLALGELEHEFPSKVKNFHFEPNIENDQLSFDYKLKPGIAQKMNATFLMKKMGIIPA
jgi:DNA mismatch repair ATPase MutS